MKIAIFGSSGFIGKNLVEFLRLNAEVQEIFVRESLWQSSIDEGNDVFINLVGKAHDHQGTATEEDYLFANVEMMQQIFETFKKSNAELFIHISSLAALEEFEADKPLVESDECRPISMYGQSKRKAEEWLLKQNLSPTKKLIIIRPPMVHGAGDKGNLGLLYKLISKGIPYPLASFNNERSFISIDNFVFYIEKIIEKNRSLENGIYHIADNETVSTKKIISIIKEVVQKKVPDISVPRFIVKKLARIGDFSSFPLNTKRLKKMTSNLLVSNQKINSALKVSKLPLTAEEGLIKTIKSFQK